LLVRNFKHTPFKQRTFLLLTEDQLYNETLKENGYLGTPYIFTGYLGDIWGHHTYLQDIWEDIWGHHTYLGGYLGTPYIFRRN